MTSPPPRRRSPARRPPPVPSAPETAVPPTAQAGTFICYADGASRGNPGPAAIGGIVTRLDGAILAQVSEVIGRATNNVAEWRAAIAILERAQALGARAVELRMDSELVVRQIVGQYRVRNEGLLPYYEQVRKLLPAFERFSVRHVPRAQNARADRLANAALDRARRPGRPDLVQ